MIIFPASAEAPKIAAMIGNIKSNVVNKLRHFLNKPSVFGSSRATKAKGDMTINKMIRACRIIRTATTVTIATSAEIRTGSNIDNPE
ncbi:hypothetical protein D3C85_1030400 [compost metagenome]